MLIQKVLTVVVLAVLGCAVSASAAIVGYTSPSGFAAATNEDTFSSISFTQGSLGLSTSEMGVVFSSNGALVGTTGAGVDSAFSQSGWPSGSALEESTVGDSISITIPAGVTAFSLYFGSSDDDAEILVTDTSGGGGPDTYALYSEDGAGFAGFVTNTSFNTITIIDQGSEGNVAIDDMQAQTPEVATLLLVGTGLLGMGYMRRRKGQRPLQELPA